MTTRVNTQWLRVKRYPHIGLPIERKNFEYIRSIVTNPDIVSSHSFLPLIRREIVTHPYKFDEKTGEKKRVRKVRNITYSSHFDSVIFAYYAEQLQLKYEELIKREMIEDVVVAYRKIPKSSGKGNKCNIDIAGDVFNYIKIQIANGYEVAVITFDIKGFFDNLNHDILKRQWKKVINVKELPKDVYAVYKHTTRYSYINENKIFGLFKDEILCESCGKIVKRKVKRLEYMRSRNALAFCEKIQMPNLRKSGYIQRNILKKGIPQGLPISAVLANVYMFDFDKEISNCISKNNGIYRRYSDDIIVVCPIEKANEIRNLIIDRIKKEDLEIQRQKTNLYEIHKVLGKTICVHETKGIAKKIEYSLSWFRLNTGLPIADAANKIGDSL